MALKGSATAAAPMLVLSLDTRRQNIAVGYKLRDLDGSANNAVQPVALQYRVATNAAYVDVPPLMRRMRRPVRAWRLWSRRSWWCCRRRR